MEANASILRSEATGSGAFRWINCPGSVALSHGIEEAPKKYADAGTEAHALAARILKREISLEEIKDEAVKIYIETIIKYSSLRPDLNGSLKEMGVEERLDFLGSSGGLDCYVIRGDLAYLFDFKYGEGIKLRAKDNAQLAFYACALRNKYPHLKKILCVLVQPKIDDDIIEDTPHIDEWLMRYQTLEAWKRKFIKALDAVEKSISLNAGPWCRFCKAKPRCPIHFAYAKIHQEEQEKLPANYMEVVVANNYAPIDKNTIEAIARVWSAKDRIKKWLDSAEEFLFQLKIQGHEVPHVEIGQKRSYRVWSPLMTKEEIGLELMKRGLQDPYEHDLMPLTRAEKLVNIDGLTEKPPGAPKLKVLD